MRVLARGAGLLGLACTTTALVQEAAERHHTSAIAGVMLGRALTASALLGAQLKVGQRIALKIDSNGPIQRILVESDSYSNVRGYVTPNQIELTGSEISPGILGLFGDSGRLTVVKDLVRRGLSDGVVGLQYDDLDQNITHYLFQSEQVRSHIETAVVLDEYHNLAAAGGVLIQTLPRSDEDELKKLRVRLESQPRLVALLEADMSPEAIIRQRMQGLKFETLEEINIQFRCTCSWKRTEQALRMIGREEIMALIAEGEAVVDCHYCHEQYVFGRETLEEILEEL